MKNWFLQFQINKLLNQKIERVNVSFSKATKFAILFDSVENYKKSKPLVEKLTQMGKQCKVLVKLPYKKEQNASFPFFTVKDISFFGKINSENLLDFSKEKFDFLFYFGKNSDKIIDLIMLKSKASCRVGYHKGTKEQFFDLMFSNSLTELDVLKKIQEIKVNE